MDIVAGMDGALQTAGEAYMTKVCNSRTLAPIQQVTVGAVYNKHFCYKMVKTGQFTTKCKGNKVIGLKQQISFC